MAHFFDAQIGFVIGGDDVVERFCELGSWGANGVLLFRGRGFRHRLWRPGLPRRRVRVAALTGSVRRRPVASLGSGGSGWLPEEEKKRELVQEQWVRARLGDTRRPGTAIYSTDSP